MFSRLSESDKITFDNYINIYGPHCEGDDTYESFTAPIETILQPWAAAKSEYLGKLFGDSLILEKNIAYHKRLDDIEDDLTSQLGGLYYDWTNLVLYSGWIWETYWPNKDLYPSRNNEPHFYDFVQIFSYQSLAAGHWVGGRCRPIRVPIPNTKHYLIINGETKIMKVLSKIAKITGTEELFEQIRVIHSQVMNNVKTTGTLCLSIHPMDYVTMSDTSYGWNSCMSWTECEGYRAGTVEMMNSPCVVVAYLKGDRNTYLTKDIVWNGKRWRQLFIVHPEVVCGVKGYPYYSSEMTDITLCWLRELVQERLGWKLLGDDIPEVQLQSEWIKLTPAGSLIFRTNNMYNDFASRPPIHHFLTSETRKNINNVIDYSGPMSCMNCGDTNIELMSPSHVFCRCCEPGFVCCSCGNSFNSNYQLIYIGDDIVCQDCAEDYTNTCAISDDCYWVDDLNEVYFAREKDNPTDGDLHVSVHFRYCGKNGLQNISWGSSWFAEGVTSIREKGGRFYFNIDDLTMTGADYIFGLYNQTLYEEYIKSIEDPFDFY